MGLENFLLNLDDNFLVQINSLDGKIDLTIGVVCAFWRMQSANGLLVNF